MTVNAHILISDDEKNLLHPLEFILEAAGYKVSTAGNGQEALEIILKFLESVEPVAVLITDIKMPVLNGPGLIDKLEQLHIDLPIIVMSEYGPGARSGLRGRVFDAYIEKPFTNNELLQRISLIVNKQRGDPAL